jgi:hypothetical protein
MSRREQSDDQLTSDADRGLQGQGAVVESLRRHREVMERLDRSATRLSRVGVALTIAGLLVAAVQTWLAWRG